MSSPTIKKAYIDTASGQIHYRFALPSQDVLKKSTPLLFLHKSASSSASYTFLMTIYSSRGYACFAPDMPGFGNSFDPSPSDITEISTQGTKWFVEIFMQAFHSLNLFAPKVHIIGHHSGAVLATEIAATYPDLVSSICLVGPAVMTATERAVMKGKYFSPFNEPVKDGSHLLKTWEYLGNMGVGDELGLWQREVLDHVRAWKGRNLIYGAVWELDAERVYAGVRCPVMLMCARDDVLWTYFQYVKGLKSGVKAVEIGGANFGLDRDVQGIEKSWTEFLEETEKKGQD
jgi:pimeloyl-ACP methyl ester carboxylesterase